MNKIKAIFLDRDGVINRYPGDTKYVTAWKDFRFLPGAKQAIAKLYAAGFKLFIVSNQAGVGKGIYSQKKLDLITANMLRQIREAKGRIERVYCCVHRPEDNCACRKPKAGAIHLIAEKYPLDLKKSFFIGDTGRDIKTAHAAGCKSIMVLCGKEKLSRRPRWEAQPDFIFKNLLEAADFIIK
ncbi:HAD family hydrolase [bacterium]|nr:MAG: HAD family hydrolase [bacterium]